MKKISQFSVLLALLIAGCKKTEIETPLQLASAVNHYPSNYVNPGTISKRSIALYTNGPILGVAIDSTNKQNAFVYGSFNIGSGLLANGIVKYQTANRTTVTYPINITNAKINTFCQYNGLHYFGGSWNNISVSGTWNFGYKSPSVTALTCPITLNDEVKAMQVKGNDLYFAGDFFSCSAFSNSVPPMLFYSGGILRTFASANYARINSIAYHDNNFFAASTSVAGNVMNSTGSVWYTNTGYGFDYSPNELAVFSNTLYAAGKMTESYGGNPLGYVCFLGSNGFWQTLGSNSLPNECLDLDYYNGILYACGLNYIYYYDVAHGTWNNYVANNFTVGTLSKICFIQGKLYAVENVNTLVLFE